MEASEGGFEEPVQEPVVGDSVTFACRRCSAARKMRLRRTVKRVDIAKKKRRAHINRAVDST